MPCAVEEKTSKAASQYESTKAQLGSHDSRVQSKVEATRALEESVAAQESRLGAAKAELAQADADESALSQERQALRNTLAECHDAVATSSSRGQILTNLIQEKKKGRLNGLHGRLGELGTIDAKYDVAITTACGALNNLVVDDTVTGSKCIEYLRQQRLGRATFLVLDKVSHLQVTRRHRRAWHHRTDPFHYHPSLTLIPPTAEPGQQRAPDAGEHPAPLRPHQAQGRQVPHR